MLGKTHLAIGVFVGLFFIEHVSQKFTFVVVLLIASLLPDIDSGFSTLGKNKLFKPLQVLTKHRGVIHSFTLAILLSLGLAVFFPVFALPFFLGYSLHLFADSFTPDGIRVFWPLQNKLSGKIRAGGAVEDSLFVVFVILDVVFLILLFI